MNQYRYTLEPYSGKQTRYTCPACQKAGIFTRYIDTHTGQHIACNVGMCSRLVNCGYHYTPRDFHKDHNQPNNPAPATDREPLATKQKPVSYIPYNTFAATLNRYEANNFVTFLHSLFIPNDVKTLCDRYHIGTAKKWPGGTVFWQIDSAGNVRTGKIMQYNPDTGRRIKARIGWAHNTLKQADFQLKQCFFGQHLLQGNTMPVAIVESEKTAIIASIYLPKLIWLACGSLSGLEAQKCTVLQGRKVVLFPDLKATDIWKRKAKELEHITTFTVSELLENRATTSEKEKGLDLADYLIRYSYREFTETAPVPATSPKTIANHNTTREVAEQFKNEFLQPTELPVERQWDLWKKYERMGLPPTDAKAVCIDLLNNYGFVIEGEDKLIFP